LDGKFFSKLMATCPHVSIYAAVLIASRENFLLHEAEMIAK
jgi:hypothetical protein